MKLLHEKGTGGLTLRACARMAGVSHAAPQHHFESVASLLAEIAARGFETFVSALDEKSASAATPLDRLEAMCEAYVRFALSNGPVYGLMFRQGASELKSAHLKETATAAWQQLASAVAGALDTDDPSLIMAKSAFVWSQVHGLATLLLDNRFPPEVNREALISGAARGVIAALQADNC
jgi:AcrR family transcriptional regulator